MMKKKILSKNITIFLIAGIFFCLLTLLRFAWLDLTNVPEGISAKQGTVDLRAVDTSYDFKTKLQGEWALYPDTLLVSEKSSVQDEKKFFPTNLSPGINTLKSLAMDNMVLIA